MEGVASRRILCSCENCAKLTSGEDPASLLELDEFNFYQPVRWISRVLKPENLETFKVDGDPSLHYLAECPFEMGDFPGLEEVIRFLLHSGYDIDQEADFCPLLRNCTCMEGVTALQVAVAHKNLPFVKCLLQSGARTDIRDKCGFSVIHWTIFFWSQDCFEKLIESGASVKTGEMERSGQVQPVLHTAICAGRTEIVRYLLENELVDPTEEAVYKMIISSERGTIHPGWYDNQEELKSMESDVISLTPLSIALIHQNEVMAQLLLELGKIELATVSGDLERCIKEGYTQIASKLVKNLSKEEIAHHQISKEWALLKMHRRALQEPARLEGTKELIRAYRDSGWDVDSVGRGTLTIHKVRGYRVNLHVPPSPKAGETMLLEVNLLHRACFAGQPELIKFLVKEMGADVNRRTGGDALLTPLHISIICHDWESAMHLVEGGADINTTVCFKGFQITNLTSTLSSKILGSGTSDFTAAELLLLSGAAGGLQLLKKLVEMGVTFTGAKDIHLAIVGGNPHFVSIVLNECDLSGKVSSEDLKWLPRTMENTTPVPTLCHLIRSLGSRPSLQDVEAFEKVMKTMVEHGYDCNHDSPHVEGTADADLLDPLIFQILKITNFTRSTQLLRTLLQFNHVNVNLRNGRNMNPVEYVISKFPHPSRLPLGIGRQRQIKHNSETIMLLVSHGVDVSGNIIRKGVLNVRGSLQPKVFHLLLSLGLRIQRIPKWNRLGHVVKRKDLRGRDINLQHLCRGPILKMCKNIGEMRNLPKLLRIGMALV